MSRYDTEGRSETQTITPPQPLAFAPTSELTSRMTDDGSAVLLGQLHDLLDLLAEAPGLGILLGRCRLGRRLEPQELIGRDLEGLGDLDDHGRGRVGGYSATGS